MRKSSLVEKGKILEKKSSFVEKMEGVVFIKEKFLSML